MKITTLIICLLAPGIATADIYKWTDEDGQIHYGEKPKGNSAKTIATPGYNKQPVAPPPDEKQRLENIRKWTDARQEEREEEKRRKAELKAKKAERTKKCNRMKNEITDLDQGGRRYRLNENGQRYYYSDKDIEVKKDKLRQSIKKNCR